MEGERSGVEITTRDLQGWSNPHFGDAKDWLWKFLSPGSRGRYRTESRTISAWARKWCFRVSEISLWMGGGGGAWLNKVIRYMERKLWPPEASFFYASSHGIFRRVNRVPASGLGCISLAPLVSCNIGIFNAGMQFGPYTKTYRISCLRDTSAHWGCLGD